MSGPVAGGELGGVCGDFMMSLKPALFLRPLLGGGAARPFYFVIRAMRRSTLLKGKDSTLIFSYFKTRVLARSLT